MGRKYPKCRGGNQGNQRHSYFVNLAPRELPSIHGFACQREQRDICPAYSARKLVMVRSGLGSMPGNDLKLYIFAPLRSASCFLLHFVIMELGFAIPFAYSHSYIARILRSSTFFRKIDICKNRLFPRITTYSKPNW